MTEQIFCLGCPAYRPPEEGKVPEFGVCAVGARLRYYGRPNRAVGPSKDTVFACQRKTIEKLSPGQPFPSPKLHK